MKFYFMEPEKLKTMQIHFKEPEKSKIKVLPELVSAEGLFLTDRGAGANKIPGLLLWKS